MFHVANIASNLISMACTGLAFTIGQKALDGTLPGDPETQLFLMGSMGAFLLLALIFPPFVAGALSTCHPED